MMIEISFETYSKAKDHFNFLLEQLELHKANNLTVTVKRIEYALEELRTAYEILGIHMEP